MSNCNNMYNIECDSKSVVECELRHSQLLLLLFIQCKQTFLMLQR